VRNGHYDFHRGSRGLEVLKTLKEIDSEFDRATYKARIAELMSTLAEAKTSLLDGREELCEKEIEIAELRKSFEFSRDNTMIVRDMRFEKAPDGTPQGMPFCDRCERVDGRLIRIHGTHTGKDGYKAICPQCKADYGLTHGYNYFSDRKQA
jgi:hypothetical protein